MNTIGSVINIEEKLIRISEYWHPHIIASLNGQDVKHVKLKGEFIWHKHDNEDELFMVIKGQLKIEFRDRIEILSEQECIVVPRGVEHRPVADEEVHILLFEPGSTINTGNISHALTKTELKKI